MSSSDEKVRFSLRPRPRPRTRLSIVRILVVHPELAYKSRRARTQFKDNEQLTLTMSNIVIFRIVVWIISAAADLYQGPMRVFITIAIFWMSVFSSSVFVLPRLLQIRARKYSNILNHESESRTSERSSTVPGNTSSLNNVGLNGHNANAILRKHSSCKSILSAYCTQTPLEPIPDERAITRWASSDN